ncbi:SPFH domain-containing protein [Streptomyces exfoliatus]|uniref:SPFH domain-containing protein n=1 Tax=Streptomyces exfoliatus TaxID=1905 RepID=UPI003C2D484B
MTASLPNPADSGAAASRDAARTARRLTDGTLPRTSPPQGAPPGTPTGPAPQDPTAAPAGTEEAQATGSEAAAAVAVAVAGGGAEAPAAGGGEVVSPVGEAETPAPDGAGTPVAGPVLPATDGSEGGAPASAVTGPVPGGTSSNPPGLPPGLPAASPGVPKLTRDGSGSDASRVGRAGPDAGGSVSGASSPARPIERSGEPPTHPAGPARTSPTPPAGPARTSPPVPPSASSGMPSVRLVERPSGASAAAPVHLAPSASVRIHKAATGSATGTPPGTAAAPPATATAGSTPGVGVSAGRHRASSPEAPGDTARSGAPEPAPAPVQVSVPAANTDAQPGPDAPAGPGPAADRTTGPAPSAALAERSAPAPDFGRITGARVGTVAVPVAAVVRVARRKNVIGAETTGSIPVHLLFRDEPETAAPRAAGADDGGPDTVAMAAPLPQTNGRGPAIPAPSKVQPQTGTATKPVSEAASEPATKGAAKSPTKPGAKSTAKARPASKPPRAKATAATSRPAPTADPALVERPGAVLPGWVGVIGGAVALAGCAAIVWWTGAVPEEAARMLRLPVRPYHGIHLDQWALLALGVVLALFALGGLGRGRVGYAWVLTLFGDYRGTVRRTGLVWVSPLLLRRRVDVRLRHWRSEPLSSVDAKGTALDVTVLVVWRVRDTVRAALGVDGHEDYLREQVEAAMARVLSQLPADAFHEDAPTLRDAEAVGEALTRMLSAECAPVGVDVFSAQPTRIEYAPEVAAAMRRRRIAAIDAKHRDSVLTSVVDAVDDVVHRLTSRGLVELDDYERKALVKDLTVAFYTGRTGPVEGA